MINIRI